MAETLGVSLDGQITAASCALRDFRILREIFARAVWNQARLKIFTVNIFLYYKNEIEMSHHCHWNGNKLFVQFVVDRRQYISKAFLAGMRCLPYSCLNQQLKMHSIDTWTRQFEARVIGLLLPFISNEIDFRKKPVLITIWKLSIGIKCISQEQHPNEAVEFVRYEYFRSTTFTIGLKIYIQSEQRMLDVSVCESVCRGDEHEQPVSNKHFSV